MVNPFFKNHGPLNLLEIANSLNININSLSKDTKINDIKDLISSGAKDITFFHSKNIRTLQEKLKPLFASLPSL